MQVTTITTAEFQSGRPFLKRKHKPGLSPRKAMLEIQNLLSGRVWDADTPAYIAEVMERAGYEIKEPT